MALILPDRDLPINTREILYTAVTRSRSSVVIVGTREILRRGSPGKLFATVALPRNLDAVRIRFEPEI